MTSLLRQANESPGRDRLFDNQTGLSTVEYIIILLLIAVFAIAGWQVFGDSIRGRIKQSSGEIRGIQPEI